MTLKTCSKKDFHYRNYLSLIIFVGCIIVVIGFLDLTIVQTAFLNTPRAHCFGMLLVVCSTDRNF